MTTQITNQEAAEAANALVSRAMKKAGNGWAMVAPSVQLALCLAELVDWQLGQVSPQSVSLADVNQIARAIHAKF